MDIDNIAQGLHPLERKVLPLIGDMTPTGELVSKTGLLEVEVARALQWLVNKGLVSIEVKEYIVLELASNGARYIDKGFPEKRFLAAISREKLSIDEIGKRAGLDKAELSVCLGILKKNRQIEFDSGAASITPEGLDALKEGFNEEKLAERIGSHIIGPQDLDNEEKKILESLKRRKDIITEKKIKTIFSSLTPLGEEIKRSDIDLEMIESLSSSIIKDGSWKQKPFRRYDVKANVPRTYGGRKHPLTAVMDMIRQIFLEMGFEEMKGPMVETSFWCLDGMWIPQDHPARDVQDTFYLPYKGRLPDDGLVRKVAKVHETGGDSGSRGHRYKWDPEVARQLLLRTHTTATTYRYFGQKDIAKRDSAKFFYIGRVFRNEAIDATHLPEFHQVEGFVMADGLGLVHLMGFIKEFYSKMGIKKIKFKVTYNPYTEPSLEAMYYSEKRGRWLELINSGIFRPESLEPYGIKKPVIAWGLGVERLAMALYDLDKLKDILGATCDIDWLRNYKAIVRE